MNLLLAQSLTPAIGSPIVMCVLPDKAAATKHLIGVHTDLPRLDWHSKAHAIKRTLDFSCSRLVFGAVQGSLQRKQTTIASLCGLS